ncbi:MAG TPA: LacI family DNA-binding transcriptional regulator [Termitinemataceae bacterium]|nr:LacI family DNA-binding transcriptional regulator [Termitinemataceae bacterium]HOM23960.1 LacI family DNA-binding transcriptional regulator [Termitinemataceae bacterium]HPQ01017.1 LacI family DNA-binding transcriptional regulator [Termitinemataceae bacterium]
MKHKKTTQSDVARRAGVSRSMVSYVLNGTDAAIAPETRERILKAIEELNYRPNTFAQALHRGASGNLADKQIGIVMCDVDRFLRPYYAEILAGIHQAAHRNRYHIRFIRFFEELKDPVLFNKLVHPEEISGLILLSLDQVLQETEDTHVIERIKDRIEQVVCVEWNYDGLPSVSFDRQDAMYRAVVHLLNKGYKKIFYIGEIDNRTLGYKQALIEEQKASPMDFYIDNANNMTSGYEAAQRLYHEETFQRLLPQGESSPTERPAICAGSDEVAIGILRFLHEKNIMVPHQVGLISMDNIEMAAFANPPLTTINVQKRAMGEQAVELLIRGQARQGAQAVTVLLPTSLIERNSC